MNTKSIHLTRNDQIQEYLLSLSGHKKVTPVLPSAPLPKPRTNLVIEAKSIQRWAGSAFENSPPPELLPLPSFVSSTGFHFASVQPIASRVDPLTPPYPRF
eukprot:TRINITY_DN5300_c0_g1_i1.p1 TRINITY_DN5300_c0_g1~~TRINITY_DN5300_c0_g1_i1.p1  ORF type:complete len:101 (-),score=15.34 TRINITY_DN5300_c0_g1_i1:155-457(-)